MKTFSRSSVNRSAVFVLSLMGLAQSLRAALPEALEFAPPDSAAIFVVSSLDRLDRNTTQLLGSLEMSTVSTFSQTLSALGIGPALEMSGSAAIVVMSLPQDPAAVVPAALVLPTKGVQPFVRAVNAEPEGELYRFRYGNTEYFGRFAGEKFVFISGDRELVAAFDPKQTFGADHAELLGSAGQSIVEDSDAAIIAGPKSLGPVAGMFAQPLEQLLSIAQAVDPQAAGAQRSAVQMLRDRLLSESRLSIIGITTSPLGVRMDAASVFRGGTSLASLATAREEAPVQDMLRELPRQDFLFISLASFGHPAIQSVLESVSSALRQDPSREASMHGARLLAAMLKMDRASLVLYSPLKPILVEGIFGNGLARWTSRDPVDVAWRIEQYILGLAKSFREHSTIDSEFEHNAGRVSDVNIDRWTLGIPSVAATGMNAALVGTTGKIVGHIATQEANGLLSLGPTTDLIGAALNPGVDEASLADDPMLRQLISVLPKQAAAMWFFNPNPFLAQLRPFLQMMLPGFDAPEQLPPIAGSLHFEHGTARVSLFAPAPLLKFGIGVFQSTQSRAVQPAPGQPR